MLIKRLYMDMFTSIVVIAKGFPSTLAGFFLGASLTGFVAVNVGRFIGGNVANEAVDFFAGSGGAMLGGVVGAILTILKPMSQYTSMGVIAGVFIGGSVDFSFFLLRGGPIGVLLGAVIGGLAGLIAKYAIKSVVNPRRGAKRF